MPLKSSDAQATAFELAAHASITMLASEEHISLKFQSPLGENALVPLWFQGQETLSDLFCYRVHLVSQDPDVDFESLMAKGVTLEVAMKGGRRAFHGVVGEVQQLETAYHGDDNANFYEVWIYPKLWLLTFTQDCKVFQNLSVMDIVKQVLQDNGVTDIEDKTTSRGKKPREYCVQYNETSYNFILRLLEEEGIYFFFRHEPGKHTVVFADSPEGHQSCVGAEEAQIVQAQAGVEYLNTITSCRLMQKVVAKSTQLVDYNFTTASTKLRAQFEGNAEGGKMYGYPGQMDHEDIPAQQELEEMGKLRQQGYESLRYELVGESTIPFFAPGFKTQLKGHARKSADRGYVLYTVKHEARVDGGENPGQSLYRNSFAAFHDDVSFRPPAKAQKPRIPGAQTAKVVGPQNEEIWTDEYGRIKVQFHWDMVGDDNEKSSCWVRVSQGWASNNWGILFTPRIGQEVVVSFLEGNPDRPLVTGCVYNSDHMPPYLPEQPTKSTIKSNSSKGGEGFNELRFEDLKNSEQIYLHAQKDLDRVIIQNQTTWLQQGSDWHWIDRGDRVVSLSADDQAVDKSSPPDQTLPAGKGHDNLRLDKGSRTTQLLGEGEEKGSDHLLIQKGDQVLKINKGGVYNLLSEGNRFTQLDAGDDDHYIKTGSKSTTIDQGSHHTLIKEGVYNVGVSEGDVNVVVETGHIHHGITKGTHTTFVEEGGCYELIESGEKKTVIESGDHTFTIESGNQSITLNAGNQVITIEGTRSISVTGEEDHTNTASFTHTVGEEYTLDVTGNMTITVAGTLTITATGGVNIESPADITLSAGGEVAINAGGAMNLDAGGELSANAGGAMTLDAGAEASMNAGAAVSIDAGGTVTVNAPMIMLN
ncbi:MAG: type VI secretion system tip protein TssI/VgrG [Alphaproteobacteria bacterium]